MRMGHRVRVERPTLTTVDLKTQESRVLISSAMRCLVEELQGREKETIIGLIPGARYKLSWPLGEDVREHDIVKFEGSWFRIRNAAKSTGLGSRRVRISTAILEQDHGRHDA